MMTDNKSDNVGHVVDSTLSLPAVTEQQRELSNQAHQEFEKKQFSACMSHMSKLLSLRSNDPKVIHNKAVADFYNSGFKNVDAFRNSLHNICQKEKLNLDNTENLDNVDHAAVFYNQCIVMYHMRQYHIALSILDKLCQIVEPLGPSKCANEALAKKSLMFLVELYLTTHQPEKAIEMVNYVEKTYLNSNKMSQSGHGDDDKDSGKEKAELEKWKYRISKFKSRYFLMMKSTKVCKKELKSLMSSQTSNTAVLYMKSNLEYLQGSYRKAIKILNSAPQGQLFTDHGDSLALMFFNNLGCIHFHMSKPHLGAFYFRKAIQENETAVNDSTTGRPLQKQCLSRHFELLYNMGIQLLHCGKPLPAFDCLIEAVQVYQCNPRIWLRLAECCIQANREDNEEDRKLNKRLQVIKGSVGSGIHRKLILGTGINSQNTNINNHPAIPQASLEFASLCLRNAFLLLTPDPLDIKKENNEDNDNSKPAPEAASLLAAPPGNPLRLVEVAQLRCSILAASSYVALHLNNHLMALRYAEDLLRQPSISAAQTYVGRLYIAEALVELDRIADSISHLNPENITDISPWPPETKSDAEKSEKMEKLENDLLPDSNDYKALLYPWLPKDILRARATMQYNLATAHAMRGEYDKALSNLTESSRNIGIPLPAQMYFLKLYLDLMEGRRKLAQFVIKDHFGHVTPNRV